MQVRFWGVRGSIAVSGPRYTDTGGNTPCVEIVHEGLVEWTSRHAQRLRAAAADAPPARAAELREMADICDRVPAGPATTFREAVQSFFFQHLAGGAHTFQPLRHAAINPDNMDNGADFLC